MTIEKFYVYVHRRLDTGEIFYVGKGSGRRANSKNSRNDWWKNIVVKTDFEYELWAESLTEAAAFELEKSLITLLKKLGITLCNLSDGGEGGATGYKYEGEKLLRLQRHIKEQSLKTSDPAIHTFYCFNGEIFSGTRIQFCEKYGILAKDITKLFQSRNKRRVVKNWSLSPIQIKITKKSALVCPQRRSTNADKNFYEFHHVLGECFVGTRTEFSDYSQISLMKIAALFCKNPRRSVFGWALKKIEPSEYTHLKI